MKIKRCYPVLVGASVAENQLIQNGNFADGTTDWGTNNCTLTASNNVATYTRTTVGLSSILRNNIPYKANHKYLASATLKASVDNTSRFRFYSSQADSNWYQFSLTANIESAITTIFSPSWSNEEGRFYIYYSYPSGAIGDTLTVKNVMMTDLTQKFGSTIADYVYSLEQATAGSGIAWLRSYDLITDEYKSYNAGTIESVEATAKVVRDENNENAVTYPLGSDTLRGIFKLDSNNNLYADGDTKTSDGTVTRKYAELIVDGSFNVRSVSFHTSTGLYYTIITSTLNAPVNNPIPISDKFIGANGVVVGNCYITSNGSVLVAVLPDQSITTVDGATQWFAQNPTKFVYELATPTTEQSTPFQSPQVCYPDGTEEYVTSNGVPVGHETKYQL